MPVRGDFLRPPHGTNKSVVNDNINGGDVKKKCCKQCGQVKFMGTMTKWPVQKHTEHHKTRSKQGRNRHKEITIICVSLCTFADIFSKLRENASGGQTTSFLERLKLLACLKLNTVSLLYKCLVCLSFDDIFILKH